MEFALHLGPHRTGTTALQQALVRNGKLLAGRGIVGFGPARLRRPEFETYVARHDAEKADLAALSPAEASRGAMRALFVEATDAGARRLITSEENLIGTMARSLRSGTLYPAARERLGALATLFPIAPAEVFLALRNYAGHWTSAYAFTALHAPVPNLPDLRQRILESERGWVDLVAEIRAVFPAARIVVWQHAKSLHVLRGSLGRMMADPALAAELNLGRGMSNAALSGPAVRAAIKLRQQDPAIPAAAVRAAIAGLGGPDAPPFQPLTGREIKVLTRRFRADLAALREGAVPGVAFEDYRPAAGGPGA